jgi:predicted DsbA family dithiol-disulfide isomerase
MANLLAMIRVTYYLEVISSWCHWAEPAWSELKRRYQDHALFDWKLAQMPAEAYPVSRSQCDWFYRRSGCITRSPYMLSSGWVEPGLRQYTAPNLVTQAARHLGVTDDRVRITLAEAAVRRGEKIGSLEVCVRLAARAGNLEVEPLRLAAESPEVAAQLETTTREFHALQVTQRPTFLLENDIGDRALFSGLTRLEPLCAAMDALLADAAAYRSWKAHFGDPPTT